MPLPNTNKAAHSGFETQRRHQKSKHRGISGLKNGHVSTNNFKKILSMSEHLTVQVKRHCSRIRGAHMINDVFTYVLAMNGWLAAHTVSRRACLLYPTPSVCSDFYPKGCRTKMDHRWVSPTIEGSQSPGPLIWCRILDANMT